MNTYELIGNRNVNDTITNITIAVTSYAIPCEAFAPILSATSLNTVYVIITISISIITIITIYYY